MRSLFKTDCEGGSGTTKLWCWWWWWWWQITLRAVTFCFCLWPIIKVDEEWLSCGVDSDDEGDNWHWQLSPFASSKSKMILAPLIIVSFHAFFSKMSVSIHHLCYYMPEGVRVGALWAVCMVDVPLNMGGGVVFLCFVFWYIRTVHRTACWNHRFLFLEHIHFFFNSKVRGIQKQYNSAVTLVHSPLTSL